MQSEELCAEIAAIQVDKTREQGNQSQSVQQPSWQQTARFPNNNLGQQPNRQQSRRPPQSAAQVQLPLDRRPSQQSRRDSLPTQNRAATSGEMETPGEVPRCYICNETGHNV